MTARYHRAVDDELIREYRLLIADVYEVAGLSRRLSDRDAAAAGATTAQWHVLSVASDGPVTVPAVARRLGLTRQSVQRVVDELLARGHLRAEVNPGHARSPLLALTGAGHEVLGRLWSASDPARRVLLDRAGVDPEDLARTRAVLHRLRDAMRESAG